MADYLATVGSGGVFPVPDPVKGGAGPGIMVATAFNALWANAMKMADSSTDALNRAIDMAKPAPHMAGVTLDKSYLMPVKPVLPQQDSLDGEALFTANRDHILKMIQDGFEDFIRKYFPATKYYDDALQWCAKAFLEGGTGIRREVEQQLWERGKARLLKDAGRLEDEAEHTWANRRFPQPPGMLVNQLQQIALETAQKLAEQGRDISIKSFETEIENVRFAVDRVLQQRKVALDAAGDYIKALVLGPETAMKLATGLAGIRSDLARNLTALYQAEVAAAEPRIRLAITDAQLKQQVNEMNLKSDMATIEAMVRAAIADAEMKARQAASGLNGLHASAGISGSDSSQV